MEGLRSDDPELNRWLKSTRKNAKAVKEGGWVGIAAILTGVLGPIGPFIVFSLLGLLGADWFVRNQKINTLEASLKAKGGDLQALASAQLE